MIEEKNFLIQTLQAAGVKTRIHTTMKSLKNSSEIHLGAVLYIEERFTRSNSKRKYIDQTGVSKQRNRKFIRETELKVVIADSKEEKLDDILTQFMRQISRGMTVDGNWENLEIGKVSWYEKDDTILKSNVSVEFSVTFTGGVYVDREVINVGLGEISPQIGGLHGRQDRTESSGTFKCGTKDCRGMEDHS